MATKKTTSKKAVKKTAKKAKKTAKKSVKSTSTKAAKKSVAKKTAKKAKKSTTPKKKATPKAVTKAPKTKTPKAAGKKKAPVKKVKKPSVNKVKESSSSKATKAADAAAPKAQSASKKKATANKPVKLTGFVKKQHQRLLDLRDGILDAMYGVTHDTLKNSDSMESGAGGMHTGDAGSDAYDRDFALNLLAKEQDALNEIEQAIARCERGEYGICEMSGERIPNERLEAIPFARYTVQCQAEWEKENGNSRYNGGKSEFGFSNGAMR